MGFAFRYTRVFPSNLPDSRWSAALFHFLDYPYPGNIRELRDIVEYCANVCRKQDIDTEALRGTF
jgi:DNA-binding NtrC family response regulator